MATSETDLSKLDLVYLTAATMTATATTTTSLQSPVSLPSAMATVLQSQGEFVAILSETQDTGLRSPPPPVPQQQYRTHQQPQPQQEAKQPQTLGDMLQAAKGKEQQQTKGGVTADKEKIEEKGDHHRDTNGGEVKAQLQNLSMALKEAQFLMEQFAHFRKSDSLHLILHRILHRILHLFLHRILHRLYDFSHFCEGGVDFCDLFSAFLCGVILQAISAS